MLAKMRWLHTYNFQLPTSNVGLMQCPGRRLNRKPSALTTYVLCTLPSSPLEQVPVIGRAVGPTSSRTA